MSLFSRRPALRWIVPVIAALALTLGVTGIGGLTANADTRLAPRTAAQLLVDVQRAQLHALSGTIVQNADLGLPSLPGEGGAGSSDFNSLVSGSHTLRIWYAGPDRARVALLGSLGESDLVRNGSNLWTWSSKDKSATHRTMPRSDKSTGSSLADSSPITPQKAADEALKAIDPSTKVSTIGNSKVAGRSAYELLLEPRNAASLVGSVRIAIDGRTKIPTRVQVYARNASKPAFEVAFTSLDTSTPPASVFAFNPPPGTKVTESKGSAEHGRPTPGGTSRDGGKAASAQPDTRVVGTGWASVLVAKAPSAKGGAASPGSLTSLLTSLPKVSGTWGSGHLLRGTLFSAVLTDDGRVAVGAVAPERLYAALGR